MAGLLDGIFAQVRATLIAATGAVGAVTTPIFTGTYTTAAAILNRSSPLAVVVGDLMSCDTCHAVVFKNEQARHDQWHAEMAAADLRLMYGVGDYHQVPPEDLAKGK